MLHHGHAVALVFSLAWMAALMIPGFASAESKPERDQPGAVVNINEASADQLQLLPRVGPQTARRIIAHRERRRFTRRYQLMRVRGIGRKTYRRLRPHIAVRGPTTLHHKIKASR